MTPALPRRRRCLRVTCSVAAVVVALVTSATHVTGATCDTTGAPAPDVVTLMASTTNPATDAWIVSPDCTVETLTLFPDGSLEATAKRIERVVSVPTDTASIDTVQTSLARGADFSKATKLTDMQVSRFPSDPSTLALPPALQTLQIISAPGSELTSLDGVKFPGTVDFIDVRRSGLMSLKNVQLPARLKQLSIRDSKLMTLEAQFPATLEKLQVASMSIGKFEEVELPSALKEFACGSCGITSVRGIKWPATLKTLNLGGNGITTFEIAKADLAIFKNLDTFTANVAQSSCGGTGSLQTIKSVRVCVLSGGTDNTKKDDDTEDGAAAGSSSSSAEETEKKQSNKGSEGSSASGSQADGSTTASRSRSTGSGDSVTASSGSATSSAESDSELSTRNATSPRKATKDTPGDAVIVNNGSASSGSLVVLILGCALALAIVIVLARLYFGRQKRRNAANGAEADLGLDKYRGADTPNDTVSENVSQLASEDLGSFDVDLRKDKELLRFRIDFSDVLLGRELARGGHGVVHRGFYQDREVAIKQMHPDAWRVGSTLSSFLAEIRMCARLEHPKIVEFIGVAWHTVQDLAIVTEYIGGGDLHSEIRTYPESCGRGWSEPWTPKNTRTKTRIAMDIAEAVVYLHSFNTPIIHRDLKAKNVLLDHVGNAKLSDFGISREMSIDETMTSEIGTAAWIAPEVLRGERYSEKADIYSLGVLLVELDRCSHPYANEPLLMDGSSTIRGGAKRGGNTRHAAHKNTQIAVMVSTGKLRPSASSECPPMVAELVRRCVAYEPNERPTSMEVFYELRQVMKGTEVTTSA